MIRRIIFVIIAVFILSALLMVFRPQTQSLPQNTQKSLRPTVIQTNQQVVTLIVEKKKLISGPKTIKIPQGDTLILQIVVLDENEEIHIHGYDKSITLKKNTPAKVSFVATLSGRFPYELEHSQTEIGVLEVQPK